MNLVALVSSWETWDYQGEEYVILPLQASL